MAKCNTKWYSDKAPDCLNYSAPIVCDGSLDDGETYLLMPVCTPGSYRVVGYNWFRLSDGQFNSAVTWKTPQEAVKSYSTHNPRNATIEVK